MTVDEFLVWAENQPERYELVDGRVYAMSPERLLHAKTKFAAAFSLSEAIDTRIDAKGSVIRLDPPRLGIDVGEMLPAA